MVTERRLEDDSSEMAATPESVESNERSLTKIVGSLDETVSRARGRLKSVDVHFTRLGEALGEPLTRFEEALQSASSILDQVSPTAEGLAALQERLRASVDDFENQSLQLKSQVSDLTQSLQTVIKRQGELAERQDSLTELVSQLERLPGEVKRLAGVVDDLGDLPKKLKDVEDQLSTSALGLEEEREQADAQRRELHASINRLADAASVYEVSKQELSDEVTEKRATAERLESDLARLREEQERELADARRDLAASEGRLRQAEKERDEAVEALDPANAKIAHLEQQVASLEAGAAEAQAATRREWQVVTAPQSFEELVPAVREHFAETVSLPDTAVLEIGEFKSIFGAELLAANVWKAIGAMHEYASENPPFNGNFFEWCRDSGHARAYASSDVAMTESDTTRGQSKKSRRAGASRTFKVHKDVDASGEIAMFPHVKFGSQGQNRPRLYFHDDTRGKTGQMHIGFLGPHNEVKNAGSN